MSSDRSWHLPVLLSVCAVVAAAVWVGCADAGVDASDAQESTPAKHVSQGAQDTQAPGLVVAASLQEAHTLAGFRSRIREEVASSAARIEVKPADPRSEEMPCSITITVPHGRTLQAVKMRVPGRLSAVQWREEATTGRGEYESVKLRGREYLMFGPSEPGIYFGEDGLWHHEPGIIRDWGAASCFDEDDQIAYLMGEDGKDADPKTLADDLAASLYDAE